jgi:hypothetical protein
LLNLDVKLEEELARYRRQKTTHRSRAGAKRQSHPGEPDLITVSAAIANATTPLAPELLAKLRPKTAQDTPAQPQATSIATFNGVHPPPLPGNAPSAQSQVDSAASTPAISGGAVVGTAVADAGDRSDYLESSEELLRSLAAEEAQVKAERSFIHSLLTPIGVGSLLLLLLSSALFGYVVMNPANLRGVLARLENKLGQPKQSLPPVPETPPITTPSAAPQPNLTEQEFKRLDLGSLATLKEDGVVAPPPLTPNPSKVVSKAPSAPSGGVQMPEVAVRSETASPSTQAATPVPRAAEATPRSVASGRAASKTPIAARSAPVRSPGQSSRSSTATPPALSTKTTSKSTTPSGRSTPEGEKNRYKVVTEFQSDAALSAIKKRVPDAFVKNSPSGAKVQVGAYDNEIEARTRVEMLQKQGVPAEIQKR